MLVAVVCALLGIARAVVLSSREASSQPDPRFAVSVQLQGKTFVNKGLVAFGLLPADLKDSVGDTLGGLGSAIAVKRGSFKAQRGGTFKGTLVVQPDRGFNVDNTVNYEARHHELAFTLNPYYGDANLTFADAQNTLSLKYMKTLFYKERQNKNTTGFDPLAVRPKQIGFPVVSLVDPEMPVDSTSDNRVSVDPEGLAFNADGSFWTSDEYGPYIYQYSSTGHLIQTIQPSAAFLPFANGTLNFTAAVNPTTGRQGNQGFEGLSLSTDGRTLYALLQSATIQDGGASKSTSRYTRLVAYSLSLNPLVRPKLKGEWVVPLPQNKKGNTLAASEVHYLSDTTFLVLSRDGDGHGGDDNKSDYKQADLIDISKATNIAGTAFDKPTNPVAPSGVLSSSITPASYISFVSYLDAIQLARFGLHNGDPADATLIDAKWEGLVLLPINDKAFPDDYFLVSASDNDFLTTKGSMVGQPYDAGIDVDSQFLVWRVTLPTVKRGSLG